LKAAFTELAFKNHDKHTFGIVSNKKLAKAENIQMPSVVVYKSKGGGQELLPGPSSADALETFLETATALAIGEFTRKNEMKYMKASPNISLKPKNIQLTTNLDPRKGNPLSTTSPPPPQTAKPTAQPYNPSLRNSKNTSPL
jgi:hypothetical protein